MEFNQGAKAAIERMVEAYGVKTKLALCDALGVTASALSNRQVRDSFPAEYVLKCALDTGASLRWLTYGYGDMFEPDIVASPDVISVPRKKLLDRKLHDEGIIYLDKGFLPKNIKTPIIVMERDTQHIASITYDEVIDGTWIIDIDGYVNIREIIRISAERVSLSGETTSFEVRMNEVKFIARIIASCIPKN